MPVASRARQLKISRNTDAGGAPGATASLEIGSRSAVQ